MRRWKLALTAAAALAGIVACQPIKPPAPSGEVGGSAPNAASSGSNGRPVPSGVGNGFDASAAPSDRTMSKWLKSPYRNVGVYIGGANRACSQPNLNAGWVTTVHRQGWRLIPTYVGLQAPCSSANKAPMSSDVTTAAGQGFSSALDAVQSAGAVGLGQDTPIYYDMEAYNPNACGAAVRSFISGWISGLHQNNYLAGMYGSSGAGVNDIAAAQGDPAYQLDAIWFGHWNGDPTLYDPQYFSDSLWPNARIHQFRGGHNETWAGVTINIDNDQVGGPTG